MEISLRASSVEVLINKVSKMDIKPICAAIKESLYWYCEECDKKFNIKKDSDTHLSLIHQSSDVVWWCVRCKKEFSSSQEIQFHWKKKHPNIKEIKNICIT